MASTRDSDFTPAQVRRLREFLGLTQRDAALRFGVSLNTWSRWEIGAIRVHRVRVPQFQKLLTKLERSQQGEHEKRQHQRMLSVNAHADMSGYEDAYRHALNDAAAAFHELTSSVIELPERERRVLLATLKAAIQKQFDMLYVLNEHTEHTPETTWRDIYWDRQGTYDRLKARHRDQLNSFLQHYTNVIPANDPIWAAVKNARTLLLEPAVHEA